MYIENLGFDLDNEWLQKSTGGLSLNGHFIVCSISLGIGTMYMLN